MRVSPKVKRRILQVLADPADLPGDREALRDEVLEFLQSYVSLPTLSELNTYDSTDLDIGAQVWVEDVQDVYSLMPGPLVPDALTIIAAQGTSYYWVAYQRGRWDDLQGDIIQGSGTSALTTESIRDTLTQGIFFRHDQNDDISKFYQMPHTWDGSSVWPHLHVANASSPLTNQDIYFVYRWTWVRFGETIPAWASWNQAVKTETVVAGTPAWTHSVVTFGPLNPPQPATQTDSMLLLLWIEREGTNPLDTYTTGKTGGTAAANLLLISFDCHYRRGKAGSLTQF